MFKPLAIACLIALPAAAKAQTQSQTNALPGFDHVMVDAPHRARPLEAAVWYPAGGESYTVPLGANPVFTGTRVSFAPKLAQGTYPLIVISHGSGGNINGLGWLAGPLAARGAIVVGVNHPGTTSGDSSPRRTVQVTERTRDIPALLDTLLAHPDFGPAIDPTRISALGFSLGGATVLHLAGAEMERPAYGQYCDRFPDASDCQFLQRGGVQPHALPAEWEATNMQEPRITSIVSVDPGFGYAMTDASLAAVTARTLLINLGDAETQWAATDAGPDGADLIGRIPGAQLTRLAPAWHFSFLGECTPAGAEILIEEKDDPVCDEPKGGDRAVLHGKAIAEIAGFLGLDG